MRLLVYPAEVLIEPIEDGFCELGVLLRHIVRRLQNNVTLVFLRRELERVGRQILSATDPERFASLLQQVDEIMLRETQDWLMLMRYVEIKAG